MISCSHHGDHGCVPQAASATPIASASSSSARRRSSSARAASGNVSQRPVLSSISDAISSPAVCSPSGVASARALSSSKRLTRLCVSGSTIWNSSSIARVRSCERAKCSRASSSAARGSGMLWPIGASVPAQGSASRLARAPPARRCLPKQALNRGDVPIPRKWSSPDFLLLALALRPRLVVRPVGRAAARVRRARDRVDDRRVGVRARLEPHAAP